MKVLRRSITAAEDDYIRIGNRLYPKNAMDYPEGMTADQVSQEATRRRNAEIEQEKADARSAELTAKAEPLKQAIADRIDNGEDPLEAYFAELVPDRGIADTVAGEITRAAMRILYRDYNDGDRFFSGYGLETCGSSAEYLINQIGDEMYDVMEDIASRDLDGSEYTRAINSMASDVVNYLDTHPELLATENTEDSREGSCPTIKEWEPKYDESWLIPDSIQEHINRGDIDDTEFQWEVEGWLYNQDDARVDIYGDTIELSEMNEDTYSDLVTYGRFSRELESYAESLDDEYGDPWGDEDDYDDELDEEYDEVEESTSIR